MAGFVQTPDFSINRHNSVDWRAAGAVLEKTEGQSFGNRFVNSNQKSDFGIWCPPVTIGNVNRPRLIQSLIIWESFRGLQWLFPGLEVFEKYNFGGYSLAKFRNFIIIRKTHLKAKQWKIQNWFNLKPLPELVQISMSPAICIQGYHSINKLCAHWLPFPSSVSDNLGLGERFSIFENLDVKILDQSWWLKF